MRNASLAVLREIGVEYRRFQRAVRDQPGQRRRMIVIEMNPARIAFVCAGIEGHRFPDRQVAAKLAVGFTLDELMNDITGGKTPASFEPSIDYVVTKIPKFAFEKFPQANAV